MSDLTVTLHLAEAQAAIPEDTKRRPLMSAATHAISPQKVCRVRHSPRAALHGLPVENLNGAPGPGVDLIVHHVLQSLVVGGADEDLRGQLPSSEAVVQNLTVDQRKD